jgi:hypothetical protein
MPARPPLPANVAEAVDLSVGDLRVLQVGDLNCLAGAGTTRSFTANGYYHNSGSTVALLEKDA